MLLRIGPWLAAVVILLAPAAAMLFTDEVAWNRHDFAVAGLLLLGACGAWEFAVRASGTSTERAAAALAIVTALALVWLNLAVGVIGAENNPANLLFAGVLGVGAAGAAFARLRPRGMARALVATALAQACAGAIAIALGLGRESAQWPAAIVGLTILFVSLWLASAWSFRVAARTR